MPGTYCFPDAEPVAGVVAPAPAGPPSLASVIASALASGGGANRPRINLRGLSTKDALVKLAIIVAQDLAAARARGPNEIDELAFASSMTMAFEENPRLMLGHATSAGMAGLLDRPIDADHLRGLPEFIAFAYACKRYGLHKTWTGLMAALGDVYGDGGVVPAPSSPEPGASHYPSDLADWSAYGDACGLHFEAAPGQA